MSETASRKAYHLGLKPDRKGEPRHKGAFAFGEQRRYPGGRQQGQHDKNTLPLHEAVVQAAALSGYDKNGTDGLVGYLKNLADNHKDQFMPLLGRALLLQPNLKSEKPVVRYTTVAEARAALIEIGMDPYAIEKDMIPKFVPQSDETVPIALTGQVMGSPGVLLRHRGPPSWPPVRPHAAAAQLEQQPGEVDPTRTARR